MGNSGSNDSGGNSNDNNNNNDYSQYTNSHSSNNDSSNDSSPGRCYTSQTYADVVCDGSGSSDLGRFSGGDMMAQGDKCTEAQQQADRDCGNN